MHQKRNFAADSESGTRSCDHVIVALKLAHKGRDQCYQTSTHHHRSNSLATSGIRPNLLTEQHLTETSPCDHRDVDTMLINFPANATGLARLPTELLLEIISHFPSPPLKASMFYCLIVGGKELTERSAALVSLSQTCKTYRQIFLPLLWEKLEAFQCTDPKVEVRPDLPEWQKKVTGDIIRQLETVTIRDPALADHVQSVSFTLTEYSQDLYPRIAQCLPLLPRLTTVQIFGLEFKGSTDALRGAFENVVVPSVTTLAIPNGGHVVFPSFPNVLNIVCNFFYESSREDFLKKVIEHYPNAHRVHLCGLLLSPLLEMMIHRFPYLREIGPIALYTGINELPLRLLGRLRNLRLVKLTLVPRDYGYNDRWDVWSVSPCVMTVLDTLRQIPAGAKEVKKLIINSTFTDQTEVYVGRGTERLVSLQSV
ncbi:uncharacterized protein BT62DRAFT_486599 [Guyanagaster necrorhizus]|uniref:F-box domain-containing protein n=1 Tax=Guyanagaster necrorhizus TaxID=856835 RepID=A0A9P7VK49_9AGAR|nr:uncharacterized protein BT62DRAFT_486599 [Guyanagaster necrorhizus MCA 3950]KAG7441404.1 hypothetical protein BT62DRAFT_486599 [Guyanagaster necrorhizus MCA 3950]